MAFPMVFPMIFRLEEMSEDLQVRQRRAKLRRPGVGCGRGKQRAHDQRDEHHGQRVVEIRFYGLSGFRWVNDGRFFGGEQFQTGELRRGS